jgi:hypothetical protein
MSDLPDLVAGPVGGMSTAGNQLSETLHIFNIRDLEEDLGEKERTTDGDSVIL